MPRFTFYLGVFLSALTLLSACAGDPQIQQAFYRWQSGDMSVFEEHTFTESGGTKMYLKLFEVAIDGTEGSIPHDKVYAQFSDEFLRNTEIVPCIFIENDVIKRSTTEELEELAENIVYLTDKYLNDKIKEDQKSVVNWKEIQIDCDWMQSSKEKYFSFMRMLRKRTDKQLSCTLRLYPYKFQKEMGVPPVDRAMLLCYNLSNPKANPDKNTILDMDELKKYLLGAKTYPLPLDVGVPMYSSCYKFTNGQFDEAIHGVPEGLEGLCLPSEDGLWYTVKADSTLDYSYYRKGQHLKIERVSKEILLEACTFIRDHVPLENNATVAIYHLSESELKNYTHETLDSVFLLFNQH